MLITSRGYMQTRSLEAGVGLVMLISGVIFALPGQTMAGPAYATLRNWVPAFLTEEIGGTVLIVTAIARWLALYINSHHFSTPVVRFGACVIGAAFWMTAAVGFWFGDTPQTPWILGLTSALVLLEAYAGFRCGFDAEVLDSFGARTRAFSRREVARREESERA